MDFGDDRTAVCLETAINNRLNSLPVEIIDVIVLHLRSDSQEPQTGSSNTSTSGQCACIALDEERHGWYPVDSKRGLPPDAALQLSMTCRRMREIVFVNRVDRKVRIGMCYSGMVGICRISKETRRSVR
jgi:hypothetical protein